MDQFHTGREWYMRLRVISTVFFAAAVLAFASIAASPADFIIYTQNLLHFGQGGAAKTQAKCDAVDTVSQSVDVIVIQEVMQQAYPCASVPAGFSWEAYGPLGATTYKEFYGFLWRNTPRSGGPTIADGGYYLSAASGSFARPPHAILLSVTPHGKTTAYYMWIGNIHSVFGTSVSARRAEATATATFFSALQGTGAEDVSVPAGGFPVIIAGDWNLPARSKNGKLNPGFEALSTAGAGIEPNVPTSLNAAGSPSSAYDHFVFTAAKITLSNVMRHPANSSDWPSWRDTVSDHLGVVAEVTVQ